MAIPKDNKGSADIFADFAEPTEVKEAPIVPPTPQISPEIPSVGTNTPIEPAAPENDPPTEEEIESNSEMVLSFLDIGQNKAFGYLLEKKKDRKITGLYGTHAKTDLENALAKQEKSENANLSPDELGLLRIHEKADSILADFPLTDAEKTILRPHIQKMIKKNAGQIPDGFWAMAAVFGIFGGRVMNITQL